ncbi:MAG: LysR family transcriptional regulator [Desulfobacteraceae bacterium]|nr:LysR family transcriptional regulator [Desulfobacteraceae bacterium]
MNFDQLNAFHKVAEVGSFTVAARELFLTQPAISQQIQSLETHYGIILFDRSGKKVTLTAEGKLLLSYTDKLFSLLEQIEVLFGQLHGLQKGKIVIGATAVMGTYFLPKMIGSFNKRYPGIDFDVRMGNSHKVANMILDGKVDIGFAGRLKGNPRIVTICIHKEKLIAVSGSEHSFIDSKTTPVTALDKIPLIWREKGTQTRVLVKKWLEKNSGGEYPKKTIELQNLEAAKRTVIEGFGITILPEVSARRELHLGLLKPVKLQGFDLSADYYLFFLKKKIISKAVRTFLELISGLRLLSAENNLQNYMRNDTSGQLGKPV